MAGEITTQGATLEYGATAETTAKMCPIKDIPEFGGAPELVEITDLDDDTQRYIFGVASNGLKEFTANYVKATYTGLVTTSRTPGFYEVGLSDGTTIKWQGEHVVGFPGAGVNGALEMKIYIACSSKPVFA